MKSLLDRLNDAPPVLKEFLQYKLIIQGKSQNTVHEYYYDLRTFFRFLKKDDYPNLALEEVPIIDVTVEDLKKVTLSTLYDYMTFINISRENASAARARKVSSLKAYFKYLTERAEIIETNPAAMLELPKIKKSLPTHLNLTEAEKLLDAVNRNGNSRDICIITLFLNCGMRLSELIGINLKDIKEDTVKILGKGNKERILYLNKSCKIAISNYLRERPNDGLKEPDALFISKKKNRISEQMVQTLIKKYVKLAGLDETKYSPHKLRHTAATLMYQADVDIRILQEILGHESLTTTQIYTHVDNKQVKEAANKHPLGG